MGEGVRGGSGDRQARSGPHRLPLAPRPLHPALRPSHGNQYRLVPGLRSRLARGRRFLCLRRRRVSGGIAHWRSLRRDLERVRVHAGPQASQRQRVTARVAPRNRQARGHARAGLGERGHARPFHLALHGSPGRPGRRTEPDQPAGGAVGRPVYQRGRPAARPGELARWGNGGMAGHGKPPPPDGPHRPAGRQRQPGISHVRRLPLRP